MNNGSGFLLKMIMRLININNQFRLNKRQLLLEIYYLK